MKTKRRSLHLPNIIHHLTEEKLALVVSFTVLVVFSFEVFRILKNWDMLVRVLNARHIFSGGYYYEPIRAVLESFIIGLFSFVSSVYSVYFFIFFVSVVFLLSVFYLSKQIKLNFSYLFMFLLSPFILFYGIKNGSDLLVISFLIFYMAAIIGEKPIFAGLFLALAFVSKSYALFFSPLLLFFLWNRNLKGVYRLLLALVTAVAALVPYFIFNLLEYGNFIYSMAASYLYFQIFSSYVSLSVSLAHFESVPLIGFEEIIFPMLLIVMFFLMDRKYFLGKVMKNKRQYAIILSACVLSFVVYFSVSNLMNATGLSVFRFILPLSVFTYILAFMFFRQNYFRFIYILFVASIVIAFLIFNSNAAIVFHISYAKGAVTMFNSVYSGNCTVSSNEWVYLDYLGLYAVPYEPYQNYSGAILNFGRVNTTLPLIETRGNIYLYGLKTCSYYPSIQESRLYYDMSQGDIPNNACYWLFGIRPDIKQLYGLCNSTNSFFSNVFK